jgi:hypothetical protein
MLDSEIDVCEILTNHPNPLVACPILMMCTVADAANSIHVHTLGIAIFCSNQLCRLPVDCADIWKHHNLGNLVVERICSIHEHGMVRLTTSTLSTIVADLEDVLGVNPPEL